VALAVLHQRRSGIAITIGVLAWWISMSQFRAARPFRLVGLIFMAGFLGSLEYVLEEGPQYEWLKTRRWRSAPRSAGLGGGVLLAGADGRGAIVDIRASAIAISASAA
jgi:hypothetical protein